MIKPEHNGVRHCKFDLKLDRLPVNSQEVIDAKFEELKPTRKKHSNGAASGSQHLAHAEKAPEIVEILKGDGAALDEGSHDGRNPWE